MKILEQVKKMKKSDRELLKEYLEEEEKKKENGVNNKMKIEIEVPMGGGKHKKGMKNGY